MFPVGTLQKVVAREGIESPTRGFSMACCKFSDYVTAGQILKIQVCFSAEAKIRSWHISGGLIMLYLYRSASPHARDEHRSILFDSVNDQV